MISPSTYHDLETDLKARYIDRDGEIHGLVLAALSRQHVELLGPPGTAKSKLVREFASRFNAKHFQWLLTPDTSPDEVLGPVKISMLKQDIYTRNTTNKVPEAQIVYLDEAYKANSRLLNALLGIFQERRFNNDGVEMICPLLFAVISSNELPEDDAHLQAFRDRMLLRFNVGAFSDVDSFMAMLELDSSDSSISIAVDDLIISQQECAKLRMAQDTKDSMRVLWERIREAGIIVSPRRYDQMLSVMAAESWLSGADCITSESVIVGQNILWDTTDQIRIVAQIVRECVNPYASQAEEILVAAEEAMNSVNEYTTENELLQIARQMQEMVNVLDGLGGSSETIKPIRVKLVAMSDELVQKMINSSSAQLNSGQA